MFVFVIPFKCRECCTDWSLASALCIRAVRSMLAVDGEVRVILVCHEPPERLPADRRLILTALDALRPQTTDEKHKDKALKINQGLILAREFAPTWLMRADADDLVSRRLIPFIEKQAPTTAWYSETGWWYVNGSRTVMKLNAFHRCCGTSCVTYATHADLPRLLADPQENFYLAARSHSTVVDYLRSAGASIQAIPFPTTLYVTNTGENLTGNWLTNRRGLRWSVRYIINRRPVTKQMREEFGLTEPALASNDRMQ